MKTHRYALAVLIAMVCYSLANGQGIVNALSAGPMVASQMSPDSAVGQLRQGDSCTVLEVRGEWVKVSVSRTVGWVRRPFLNMPWVDQLVISQDWPLMESRGSETDPPDTTLPKVGHVVKGMSVKSLLIHGAWYKVELQNGTAGWVHQSVLEPSVAEVFSTRHSVSLVPDTTVRETDDASRVLVRAGAHVVQIAKSSRWSKVRTTEGYEGWVEQTALLNEDGLPPEAGSPITYWPFKKFDDLGAHHWALLIFVGVCQWFVFLVLPLFVVYQLVYRILGKLHFLSNGILKGIYGLLALAVMIPAVVWFFPTIPPYFEVPAKWVMFAVSAFYLVVALRYGIRRIGIKRCNTCRKISAGRVVGKEISSGADGAQPDNSAGGTASGAHRKVVKCRHCGSVWSVQTKKAKKR